MSEPIEVVAYALQSEKVKGMRTGNFTITCAEPSSLEIHLKEIGEGNMDFTFSTDVPNCYPYEIAVQVSQQCYWN